MAIVVGFGLALLATASAWVIAATVPVAALPGLARICQSAKIELTACSAAAAQVGSVATITLAVAALAGIAIMAASSPPRREKTAIDADVMQGMLAAVALAMAALAVTRIVEPLYADRLAEIDGNALYFSLENLLWPLLVQIAVWTVRPAARLAALAMLATLMATTPYRTMLLSAIVFALAIPLLAALWKAKRLHWPRHAVLRLAAFGALTAALSLCAVWSAHVNRSDRDIPATAEAPKPLPLPAVVQRAAAPAYQAALLAEIAKSNTLPGLGDELASKFRLGDTLGLNEYAYRRIYGRSGNGQTTTLFYGEALAYLPQLPVLWMIAAPLFLVLIWLALRAAAVDVQTLYGLALWRSSLAGIVTVLPALAVQTAALVAMAGLSRMIGSGRWLPSAKTRRSIGALFALSLGVLTLVNVWLTADLVSRNSIWRIAVAPPPGCHFQYPDWELRTMDQALARHGLNVRSSVAENLAYDGGLPVLSVIEIPDGARASRYRDEAMAAMTDTVSCAGPTPAAKPLIVGESFVPLTGSIPLHLCAIGLLMAAAALALRGLRRGIDPQGRDDDRSIVPSRIVS